MPVKSALLKTVVLLNSPLLSNAFSQTYKSFPSQGCEVNSRSTTKKTAYPSLSRVACSSKDIKSLALKLGVHKFELVDSIAIHTPDVLLHSQRPCLKSDIQNFKT